MVGSCTVQTLNIVAVNRFLARFLCGFGNQRGTRNVIG